MIQKLKLTYVPIARSRSCTWYDFSHVREAKLHITKRMKPRRKLCQNIESDSLWIGLNDFSVLLLDVS